MISTAKVTYTLVIISIFKTKMIITTWYRCTILAAQIIHRENNLFCVDTFLFHLTYSGSEN